MSASDLISRAARFLVLAEQAFRLDWLSYAHFWVLSASLVVEPVSHLPALTAAVRETDDPDILDRVVFFPLPDVLPPEAVPWHNRLVTAWEVHRASRKASRRNPARLALVRLDGCGMPEGQERASRLPEWLAEAQKIVNGEWRVVNGRWQIRGATVRSPVRASGGRRMSYWHLQALAALAAWRPAPRVVTPPETLRAWVDFWMEMRRSTDPVGKGIAAIALLNLPEADLRAASISPVPGEQLLKELAAAIPVAVKKTVDRKKNYLLLLDWQPTTGTTWPVTEVRNVAQAWLDVTRHGGWMDRHAAWQQLIRWDRAGSLALCGVDLLSELVKAVPTENAADVLWAMAQWSPAAERFTSTGPPDSRSQLQQLEGAWKQHRTAWYVLDRAAAWLAGIHLHRAGVTSEPPENFLKAYLSTVADTQYDVVLFTLAQWSPDTDAPGRWRREWHKAWQERLLDEDKPSRRIAAWAFLRQSLVKEDSRSLRCAALTLWRAGGQASSEARHIPGSAFSRFQEMRARLAAGKVPDFQREPSPPAERHRPPLALPPGHITGGEWKMENEEWKMENGKWRMKDQEVTAKPNHHLNPNRPSW